MKNQIKSAEEITREVDKIHKEIQPALYESKPKPDAVILETEKDLNAKILQITMTISEKYPELSKYIEEMPETIPDEKDPEITKKHLKGYYNSLNTMLNKYILEHQIIGN
ncbi:MAG: hypothetical protein Q8M15_14115 [Bacteroidota bacterium]|nr:hypothetical protein [Bacteroidota bacterium]